MEILLTVIALTAVYFILRSIFIYEVKLASISIKTENRQAAGKSKPVAEDSLYYTSYKYLG